MSNAPAPKSLLAIIKQSLGLGERATLADRIAAVRSRLEQYDRDLIAIAEERERAKDDADSAETGGRSFDFTVFAALDGRVTAKQHARAAYGEHLTELEAEAAAERKREAVAGVEQTARESARQYANAWAIVAVGAAALRRMGAIPPMVGGGPAEVLAFAINDGVSSYANAARSALAQLEALGGNAQDLTQEILSGFPFGAEPLPLAAVEKALAKLLPPGGLEAMGATARESAIAEKRAAAEALTNHEQLREDFRRVISEGAAQLVREKSQTFIESDERWKDLMATAQVVAELGLIVPRLQSVVASATHDRHEIHGGAAGIRWLADRFRAARACGWPDGKPLP